MNISDIKTTVATLSGHAILSLDMSRQLAIDPTDNTKKIDTPWFSYWDNTNRIRVVMAEEIYMKIKAAKAAGNKNSITGLALKPVQKETPTGKLPYDRYVVIMPNIDDSF